jgi:hypothetical protein
VPFFSFSHKHFLQDAANSTKKLAEQHQRDRAIALEASTERLSRAVVAAEEEAKATAAANKTLESQRAQLQAEANARTTECLELRKNTTLLGEKLEVFILFYFCLLCLGRSFAAITVGAA